MTYPMTGATRGNKTRCGKGETLMDQFREVTDISFGYLDGLELLYKRNNNKKVLIIGQPSIINHNDKNYWCIFDTHTSPDTC
jgi:hypothetical protein